MIIVGIITFVFAVMLTKLGIHFADLTGSADAQSMSEFFYGTSTLVIGFFCFLAYTGSLGTICFTLFLLFKPELEKLNCEQ